MRTAWLIILVFASGMLSEVSRAQDSVARYGFCHTLSGDFAVYSSSTDEVLTVVSSALDSTSGLHLTTAGQLNRAANRIDLPGYWRPAQLSLSDCQLNDQTNPLNLQSLVLQALRPPVDLPMRLQSYFIEGDPSQDVDLPTLIREEAAFPVSVHIICTMNSEASAAPSPLACSKIRILENIIPVNPPYGLTAPARASGQMITGASVVALESSLCSAPSKRSRSSASVIHWQNKSYLLTAASAVTSELGKNSCSEAILADGHRVPLQLVRQDFASGLALFESSTVLPGMAIKSGIPDDLPDQAQLIGVPLTATTTMTVQMELLSDESNRHSIPRLTTAIEVLGTSVDAGYVGSALVNDQGEMIGLNSDEFLKIFPGSLTRPTLWRGAAGEEANHLVVIPAQAIVDWLGTKPEAGPLLWQIAAGQIQSGNLIFTEDCPPLDATQPVGEYPIGGLDPVGIGGDSSNYRACRIKVSQAPISAGAFFDPREQVWADQLEQDLAAGDSVELDYQVWRENNRLQRSYFYSVQSFFQELAAVADGHAVVALVTPSGATHPGLDPRLANLRSKASVIAERVRSRYLADDFGDPAASLLLRQIYLLSTLVQSEQWKLVQAADIELLLAKDGEFAKAWGLIELGFGGVGLHQALPDLEQALKAVQ